MKLLVAKSGYYHQLKRVVYYHDSHDFGGMELYLIWLLNHLDRDRFLPAVMAPGYKDPFRSSSSKFLNMVRDIGVEVLQPPDPGNNPLLGSVHDIAAMTRLLRMHSTDIVHIHTCRVEGARKVTLASRAAGVSGVIRSEHFSPSVTANHLSKFRIKPFDLLTDFIVTGSMGDRREQIDLLGRSQSKVVCIHNSIEVHKFNPDHDVKKAKIDLGLDPEIPVIGTVGRLVHAKGHTYLIEAARQITDEYGPVNFLLVGDGSLKGKLKSQSRNLSVDRFVHFVGHQDNVIPYMQAMDIAAMPSLYEVFSLAMLEFMALGKPIVASNHSSFREAITHGGNGLIVKTKNSQALAGALLSLLHDKSLRANLGSEAQKHVRQHFSFNQLADKIMNLYERVLR